MRPEPVDLFRHLQQEMQAAALNKGMQNFWQWLVEGRKGEIEPSVLRGYDLAFIDRLKQLIGRTSDPGLRAKLVEMLDCPVRDSRGNCRTFAEYIHAALLKNRIADRYNIEAALGYVIQKMLMDRSELTGEPRASLFGGFTERPHTAGFNPLQARFMSFLQGAINNIRKGKIPRLLDVERRPSGTVSIGQGGDDTGVPPDAIPSRPSSDAALKELTDDLTALLRRKEPDTELPLVDLFRGMLSGRRSEEQRKRFGDRAARTGRQVIVQTVREYGTATGNRAILSLLSRLEGKGREGAVASRPAPAKEPKPKSSDKERDYASIVRVVERLGRPAGTADLGKYRRRWLDYPPRNAASGYRNRLEEVLAQMVGDGVLRAVRSSRGAVVYVPGKNFDEYRTAADASNP